MNVLTILLLTYDRLEYAERTLRSTLALLKWKGELRVHIADDGSSESYRRHLEDVAWECLKELGNTPAFVTVSNSEQRGYGASYNLALQQVHLHADYVLPLEDDWELQRELDAELLASALDGNLFGCIRLGYIGFTQPLKGEVVAIGNLSTKFLLLDPDSEEPHVFAGHPRLETVEWQKKVGPWPEGLDPGSTEFKVAKRKEARQGVVWPMDYVKSSGDLFHHVGTVQARTDQKESVEA